MNTQTITEPKPIVTQIEGLLVPLIHMAALLEQASELVDSLPAEDRMGPRVTGHNVGSTICALVDMARNMTEEIAGQVTQATDDLLAERKAAL